MADRFTRVTCKHCGSQIRTRLPNVVRRILHRSEKSPMYKYETYGDRVQITCQRCGHTAATVYL